MTRTVNIKFQPILWKNEHLNNASQNGGVTTCLMSGETKEQLFEDIRHKIWAMSSEACILNEDIAAEYNRWIANSWKQEKVPTEINSMGQRDMYFALPYSESFKQWLRKNN